jgi:drug/metabolite transporter (DMT)-like permease
MPFHIWPAPQYGAKTSEEPAALGYTVGLTAWFLLGGVFVAAKFGISEMPPWMLSFFRLLIATFVLLPFVWSDRGAMIAFLRERWLEALAIGALGLGITQGLLYTALLYTSAVNAGIVNSISPILTLILAKIFLNEPMGRWQYLGSAIAFAGIVVTAVQGSLATLLGLQFGFGDLLVFVGAGTLAGYTVRVSRLADPRRNHRLVSRGRRGSDHHRRRLH